MPPGLGGGTDGAGEAAEETADAEAENASGGVARRSAFAAAAPGRVVVTPASADAPGAARSGGGEPSPSVFGRRRHSSMSSTTLVVWHRMRPSSRASLARPWRRQSGGSERDEPRMYPIEARKPRRACSERSLASISAKMSW